jgi:16S rRNA (adenine(1408)-N(1))-methyltransferase
VVADVGTGDGRAVLARARAEPSTLALGVDAAAIAMAESSRRAARRGPVNALFLVAGAETLGDTALVGRVDLVTVTFPWGSLLRGVLGSGPSALAGLAALLAPGGRVEVLASVVPSDGIEGVATLDAGCEPQIRRAWAEAGLDLTSMRPATATEIGASHSSWARRLDPARATRPVWRLELCRP